MTAAQLLLEHAKTPRLEYDSDDDPIRFQPLRTSEHHVIADTVVAEVTAALLDPDDDDDLYDPYDPGVERVLDTTRRYSPVAVAGANPDSMVQDPFSPAKRCTLKERDELLHDEQEYRKAHNMPLLVQDPDDSEHWIEPCELQERQERLEQYAQHSIVKVEVCEVTRELFRCEEVG